MAFDNFRIVCRRPALVYYTKGLNIVDSVYKNILIFYRIVKYWITGNLYQPANVTVEFLKLYLQTKATGVLIKSAFLESESTLSDHFTMATDEMRDCVAKGG